jgi:hypothetical protein
MAGTTTATTAPTTAWNAIAAGESVLYRSVSNKLSIYGTTLAISSWTAASTSTGSAGISWPVSSTDVITTAAATCGNKITESAVTPISRDIT